MKDDPLGFLSPFDAIPGSLVIAFVLVVGIAAAWTIRNARVARTRKRSIAATVAANGFSYVAEDFSLVGKFFGPPFETGSGQDARDVVAGTLAGGPFQTYVYSYDSESRDSDGSTTTVTHRFQVTWVPLPAKFPHVRLTPDHGRHHGLGLFEGHDIDTESAAFNERWSLRASDERVAHAILTGPMIERLLGADVQGRPVIFQGEHLMSFAPQASDLTDLSAIVGMLHEVAALVPPFLVNDLNGPEAS